MNLIRVAMTPILVFLIQGQSKSEEVARDRGKWDTMRLSKSAHTLPPVGIEAVDGRAQIDLGTVKSGSTTQYRLPLLNNTSANLRIEAVKSNCGCTVGVPETRTLGKQSQTDFAIVFTPKSGGSAVTTIFIEFVDYPDSRFAIALKSNTLPKFEVKQSVFRLRSNARDLALTIVDNFPNADEDNDELIIESVAFRSPPEIRQVD